LGQSFDELVGVEVIVPLEDEVDERAALLRNAFSPALQILLEPLARRESNMDFA
jgi:hypothetical protein